jgi:hypothetical protein
MMARPFHCVVLENLFPSKYESLSLSLICQGFILFLRFYLIQLSLQPVGWKTCQLQRNGILNLTDKKLRITLIRAGPRIEFYLSY